MIVTDLNQPPRPGMIFLDLGNGPFGQSATFRIETKYSESIIEQATTSPMGDIVQRVIRLQDEGVRDALIALGWTPPEAARDRLASDLQATRAELEETRYDLAKFQWSERVLAEMLREKVAELEMVRRNHLRRMRDLIELILQVMPFTRNPHWWRHRERLLGKIRAALASMETGEVSKC